VLLPPDLTLVAWFEISADPIRINQIISESPDPDMESEGHNQNQINEKESATKVELARIAHIDQFHR